MMLNTSCKHSSYIPLLMRYDTIIKIATMCAIGTTCTLSLLDYSSNYMERVNSSSRSKVFSAFFGNSDTLLSSAGVLSSINLIADHADYFQKNY